MGTLDDERTALIQQIESAFADSVSGEALAAFLRELPLTNPAFHEQYPHEPDPTLQLNGFFRERPWQELVGANGLVPIFTDVDELAELSDDALLYYLPAFLVTVVQELDWTIYLDCLTPRIVRSLGRLSQAQVDALITVAEYKVG